MEGIALVDGDLICYKACHCAEYMTYDLPDEGLFRYKQDAKDYIQWNYEDDEREELLNHLVPVRVVLPIGKAKSACDEIIGGALNALGVSSYEVYLSGKDNFRKLISYPVKYKGNRKAEKPVYFEFIREYLIEKYNAKVVDGMEADDILSIRQHELRGNSVIVSIDKDMKQVPGKHYNTDTKEIITINKLEAFRNLGIQMLTGDATDNILGIDGLGPKKAQKILGGKKTEKEIYDTITAEYKKFWPDNWNDMLLANLSLLTLKVTR